MLVDVLGFRRVFRGHLRHLAQHESTGDLVANDVTTLAIRFGAFRHFDHERSVGVFEVLGQSA